MTIKTDFSHINCFKFNVLSHFHYSPGKGWITKAGKYTVERINRQGRAGRVSFTSTVNKCAIIAMFFNGF